MVKGGITFPLRCNTEPCILVALLLLQNTLWCFPNLFLFCFEKQLVKQVLRKIWIVIVGNRRILLYRYYLLNFRSSFLFRIVSIWKVDFPILKLGSMSNCDGVIWSKRKSGENNRYLVKFYLMFVLAKVTSKLIPVEGGVMLQRWTLHISSAVNLVLNKTLIAMALHRIFCYIDIVCWIFDCLFFLFRIGFSVSKVGF